MNATIAISIRAKFWESCYPMVNPKSPRSSHRKVLDLEWRKMCSIRAYNARELIMTIHAGKIQYNWGQILLTNAMANISTQAAIWKHSLIWKIIPVQKSIISDGAVSIIHREQVYEIKIRLIRLSEYDSTTDRCLLTPYWYYIGQYMWPIQYSGYLRSPARRFKIINMKSLWIIHVGL